LVTYTLQTESEVESPSSRRGSRHYANSTLRTEPLKKPGRKPGRPRKLLPWQISYISKAARLRRVLTDKAIAKRLSVTASMVGYYATGAHKDWP
jgi:hypothetical protein